MGYTFKDLLNQSWNEGLAEGEAKGKAEGIKEGEIRGRSDERVNLIEKFRSLGVSEELISKALSSEATSI